jgi:hypothetical protein
MDTLPQRHPVFRNVPAITMPGVNLAIEFLPIPKPSQHELPLPLSLGLEMDG